MLTSGVKAALGWGVLGLVVLACSFPIGFPNFGEAEGPVDSEAWQGVVDAVRALMGGQTIPQRLTDPEQQASGEAQEPVDSEAWQGAVDEIREMTRGQTIPQHLTDPEQPATGEVFDPNRLLEPLDHLKMREGYTLDFVYNYDGMGGRPYLYAREKDADPYENYQAFQAAIDACRLAEEPRGCDYLDFIEGDGTEEGYFQWVLLDMMGGQFYLYWHSGYDDVEIVASKARLSALVERLAQTDHCEPFPAAQQRQALRIDPAPAVTRLDDDVIVRVVWFTMWGGFYERTIQLTPTAPYQVLDTQDELLVPYDCGIVF